MKPFTLGPEDKIISETDSTTQHGVSREASGTCRNFLVTFSDGYSTLFTDKAEAEKCTERWSHDPPTIRDLDQEARDREEMIGLLVEVDRELTTGTTCKVAVEALLKCLGRLA